ncbi:MAG: DEAD/DEAH box helicase, partial [Synergistaceae bacterium]|nr:DEAD/DEAH box helicase [Synergistaceae bacterium]
MTDGATVYNSLKKVEARQWSANRSFHLPVAGAARPWLCLGFDRPLLVLLPDSRQVRDFMADADSIRAIPEAGRLNVAEALPEIALASFGGDRQMLEAQKAERGEAVSRWADSGGILLATPGALMGPLSLGGDRLALDKGHAAGRSRLIEWLAAKGYERTDIVWSPGQFTYRGGIVDLFDPKDSYPIRVEFFDDEIESMRFFATDTQRSVRPLSRCSVHALSSRRGVAIDNFFPADMHVLFIEPSELENAADSYAWLCAGVASDYDEAGPDAGLDWRAVEKSLSLYPRIRVTAGAAKGEFRTNIMGIPNFRGRTRDLEAYCGNLASRGIAVRLVSEVEHFRDWAEKAGYGASEGSISEGFVDFAAGKAFIGDLELSGLSLSSRSGERAVPLDWGDRLLPGQWVVHEDYGVARFMGSEQIASDGGVQEYLVLEYAEERRLKIPVMHFHKISPYHTYPGVTPAADSLRGVHWKKMSLRAAEQARAAAEYLVEVYAKREITSGYAFKGDAEQEREFERTFPYRETADQLRAIEDACRDMGRPIPMDRLIVGDVGFGKTEVALRAVSKAVFDGKQAAVMAPTTLLAQQHYDTFRRRFDPFGVRVEVVSRFVAPSRQKAILEDAASGKVDILIGTHRLLSQDVAFKDLGLVIVDEEHRFGVMHKEHLKNLYPSVDVLMLSATPIPRSLHMSLSGLRDLSLLQTPPRKRLPVITAVGPWSEALVRNAVIREKARGGQ